MVTMNDKIYIYGGLTEGLLVLEPEKLYPSSHARSKYFKYIDRETPNEWTEEDGTRVNSVYWTIEDDTYANGVYKVSYSGWPTHTITPHNVFNTESDTAEWTVGLYTYDGDSYRGSHKIKDIKGDWISIEMPVQILLTRYIFTAFQHNRIYVEQGSPKYYAIFGRNNNNGNNGNWEKIIEEEIEPSDYYKNYKNIPDIAYEKTLTTTTRITGNRTFNTFALVVNKILGSSKLRFADWDIYGSSIPSSSSDDFYEIDIANKKSTQINKDFESDILPNARDYHTMVTMNNKIYIFGGRILATGGGAPSDDLYEIDIDNKTSRLINADFESDTLPSSTYGHTMVALSNNIYIFGGRPDSSPTSTLIDNFYEIKATYDQFNGKIADLQLYNSEYTNTRINRDGIYSNLLYYKP